MSTGRYYQRRHSRWIARAVFYPWATLAAVAIALGSASEAGQFTPAPCIVASLILVGGVLWCEAGVARVGLEEVPGGFVVHTGFRARRLPLGRIDRFAALRSRAADRVFVMLNDGEAVRAPGLVQGQPTVWGENETTDIVTVLNRRLEEQRGAHPPLPWPANGEACPCGPGSGDQP